MEGRRPEGHITDRRHTRMEETSRRQRRMEASSDESYGAKGTGGPYMERNSGTLYPLSITRR
jgi:hypothetical protein